MSARVKAPRRVKTDWKGQLAIGGIDVRVERSELESSVAGRVKLALEAAGCVVYRNNVGAIKKGQRFIRYGLKRGSGDFICIVPPTGRFLSVETKRGKGGIVSDEQKAWILEVRRWGGIAGTATTPEEALQLVKEARENSINS